MNEIRKKMDKKRTGVSVYIKDVTPDNHKKVKNYRRKLSASLGVDLTISQTYSYFVNEKAGEL